MGTSTVLNGHSLAVIGVLTRREVGEHPLVVIPFGALGFLPSGFAPRVPSLTVSAGSLEGVEAIRHD